MKTKLLVLLLSCICVLTVKAGIHYVNVSDTTISNSEPVEGDNYYSIDLNNDGIIDFKIAARFYLRNDGPHPPYNCEVVRVEANNSNLINPGPFSEGDTIGNLLSFTSNSPILGGIPGIGGVGAWYLNNNDSESYAYLALEFHLNNHIYYGWIKLKTDTYSFTVSGYAYNDVTGQSINAGQTN